MRFSGYGISLCHSRCVNSFAARTLRTRTKYERANEEPEDHELVVEQVFMNHRPKVAAEHVGLRPLQSENDDEESKLRALVLGNV